MNPNPCEVTIGQVWVDGADTGVAGRLYHVLDVWTVTTTVSIVTT
jgi:hypothetical protein